MNSYERVAAAMQGQSLDRVPVFPQIGDHAGLLAGLTYDVMYRDARAAAEAHLRALELYGYDLVNINVEPAWPMVEAMGGTVTYPPNKYPWVTAWAVRNREELDRFHVPDFAGHPHTNAMLEGTRLLAERAGVPVVAFVDGPLTFAYQFAHGGWLSRALLKDQETACRIVELATLCVHTFARMMREAGASVFFIGEHLTQMVSPRVFRELSLPYIARLLDIFPYNVLHLCDNVQKQLDANLDAIVQLRGLNLINVGPAVSLAGLRERISSPPSPLPSKGEGQQGGGLGIAGNIDSIQLLPLGTSEEVAAACRAALAGGVRLLTTGCEVTPLTPVENIKAMVNAAKEFGIPNS
jgi:MtaA/CmuA family methyltransferase